MRLVKAILIFAMSCTLGFSAIQARITLCHGFAPPNNVKFPVGWYSSGGLSESQYNAVLDRFYSVYAPILKSRGLKLMIEKRWQDPVANSSAELGGSNVLLRMYGGMARHPLMNSDGMMLIVCHEVGHILGGAPRYNQESLSVEGEADYFANLKCLRRMWAQDDNISIVQNVQMPDEVLSRCSAVFEDENQAALCMRSSLAGFRMAKLLADISQDNPNIHFDTPSELSVTEVYADHPGAQCRLDTFFQASHCPASLGTDLGYNNYAQGACIRQEINFGYRPKCWFPF